MHILRVVSLLNHSSFMIIWDGGKKLSQPGSFTNYALLPDAALGASDTTPTKRPADRNVDIQLSTLSFVLHGLQRLLTIHIPSSYIGSATLFRFVLWHFPQSPLLSKILLSFIFRKKKSFGCFFFSSTSNLQLNFGPDSGFCRRRRGRIHSTPFASRHCFFTLIVSRFSPALYFSFLRFYSFHFLIS